jgi:hypothetical protein
MSATFKAALKALSDDPVLLQKVTTAGSAEERQAHLRAAGVECPTHGDVNSYAASMSDVDGGMSTTSGITKIAVPIVSGAAGGAAAAC